ncbi:hypothetical protein MAR_034681 [Mya arenaria]|uniref:EF-hand domain-containing protein n=1 Tax=Mya arenaria TaxID=6604 RepID=A0ABY7EHY5_MYAAR|nr:hypothetical protein MAR_034681 [Mya arenaria]
MKLHPYIKTCYWYNTTFNPIGTPYIVLSVITGVGEMISLEETIELVAATGTKDKGQVNYEEFCDLVKMIITR